MCDRGEQSSDPHVEQREAMYVPVTLYCVYMRAYMHVRTSLYCIATEPMEGWDQDLERGQTEASLDKLCFSIVQVQANGCLPDSIMLGVTRHVQYFRDM